MARCASLCLGIYNLICDELQGRFGVEELRSVGTRQGLFQNYGTTLRESSWVACGVCVRFPAQAVRWKTKAFLIQAARRNKAARSRCSLCGISCEMIVGTRDNGIVQMKPVR